jgi:hypothetical protein
MSKSGTIWQTAYAFKPDRFSGMGNTLSPEQEHPTWRRRGVPDTAGLPDYRDDAEVPSQQTPAPVPAVMSIPTELFLTCTPIMWHDDGGTC